MSRPASLYSTVTGLVITFLASKSFLCIINLIGALMFYVLSLRLSVTDWIIFSSLFPVPLRPLPFLFPLPQSVGASCGTFILSLHRPPFCDTYTESAPFIQTLVLGPVFKSKLELYFGPHPAQLNNSMARIYSKIYYAIYPSVLDCVKLPGKMLHIKFQHSCQRSI